MSEDMFDQKYIEAWRLMFEFFKESETESRAKNVAEQFGTVEGITFEEWWPKHNQLFADVEPFHIESLNCPADFEWFDDDNDVIRVAINLSSSKTDLRAAFEQILQKLHPGKDGAKPFEHFGEVYSLSARPDIPSLKVTLTVWRYCKAHPELELYEIEENLGLITKKGLRMHAHWSQDSCPNTLKQQRKTQTDEVNKHLRRARAIIKNVARGEFPVLK